MFSRAIRASDLEECLAIRPAGMGHEIVGRERALTAWRILLASRAFSGDVVESERPIAAHRIIGYAAAVFVREGFAEEEIAHPRPGLNARIIASIDSGRPVLLNHSEIREANTFDGLNVVFLEETWRMEVLTKQQICEVEMLFSTACLRAFEGYRLRRCLCEAYDRFVIEHSKSYGVYRTASNFDDFHHHNPGNPWNRDRALFVADASSCLAVPASVAAILFSYREPVLGLTESQQELLSAALGNLTDEELAESLGLGLPAVKKRWASVFDHISQARPGLLPEDNALNGSARGPQKRHRVIEYFRQHPEELRPFLPSRAQKLNPTKASTMSA